MYKYVVTVSLVVLLEEEKEMSYSSMRRGEEMRRVM
jgi:hypothetical protein